MVFSRVQLSFIYLRLEALSNQSQLLLDLGGGSALRRLREYAIGLGRCMHLISVPSCEKQHF